MVLLVQKLLSKQEELKRTIQKQPSSNMINKDSLIARGMETWQYIGIFALMIAAIIVVRLLSPRIEHTLLFAAALTTVLIVFFLT